MSAAVRLHLVRHAEVDARHPGTFYGSAAVPLSPRGLEATRVRARELAALLPDHVYTSPLSRARLLAELVAEACGAPLTVLPALRELDRGAWTLRRREDILAQTPDAIARYVADPEHGNGPGGERESELCARVWAALDAIAARHAGGLLVVACHGHVIRVLLRRWLGWDAPRSLHRFVPYLGVVEALVRGEDAEVVRLPELRVPEALDGR